CCTPCKSIHRGTVPQLHYERRCYSSSRSLDSRRQLLATLPTELHRLGNPRGTPYQDTLWLRLLEVFQLARGRRKVPWPEGVGQEFAERELNEIVLVASIG